MASTIVYMYGKKMCPCLKAVIPVAEANLRAIGALPPGGTLAGKITQGSYNTSVSASGGTHSGGGALDVIYSLVNSDRKLAAFRNAGIAMSRRMTWEGPWANHGHGIVIGCIHASPAAKRQVTAYRNGRNGLSNNGPDTGPRVPFVSWQIASLANRPGLPATGVSKPTLTQPDSQKENKMNANELAAAILNYPVTANGKKQELVQHLADLFVATAAQSAAVTAEANRDKALQKQLLDAINALSAKIK